MRNCIYILLLCFSVQAFAQTIRGDFDLSAYPNVSFVWNEYNPNVKSAEQFGIFTDTEKILTGIEPLGGRDSNPQAKSILFLWEDLNHPLHAGQSVFTRTVIYYFLKGLPYNGQQDKFNVAVFDRKGGNDLGSSIHTRLSNDFTSDTRQLADAVLRFPPKYDFFSKQVNSELYIAIEEGISLLEREPADRIRAIVVFTAGSNLDNYGGRNSIDEARTVALKIPVYVVKYPIRGCEHCTNIDLISQKTFGREIKTNDYNTAINQLNNAYADMGRRHYGQDYRVSFTSPFPRDGRQHSIILNVRGREYPIAFTSPNYSLRLWIRENVFYSALIGATLLFFLVSVVVLIIYTMKQRQQKMNSLIENQRRLGQDAEAIRKKQQEKEKEEKEAKQREDMRRSLQLMQTKNLYPRLQYITGGINTIYTIRKPRITIGRDAGNDLRLDSDSVSRRHASIAFNGRGFEIEDFDSSNRVIVNGAFIKKTVLSNGDIIGLGEVVIYYNI